MTATPFDPSNDPGPDFASLLRRAGLEPPVPNGDVSANLDVVHGTTCVSLRYRDGVVIAGDRRATSGNIISHRSIQKVFAADRHSGVAIAGAAGPAVEMVKLFQLQLEHYEKVEGSSLSLEGKANQLSMMLRNNLPMAMQGLAVVPIFAGYDLAAEEGRLFQYDVTGGRYEELDYTATGSGSLHAGTVIKISFIDDMDRDQAVNLAIEALFQAADSDSATGLPDLIRGVYPVVATITAEGFDRVEDSELEDKTRQLIEAFTSRGGRDGGNSLSTDGGVA